MSNALANTTSVQRNVITEELEVGESCAKVIMPGSQGLNLTHDNEIFVVESVFYSPRLGEVFYKGYHESEENRRRGRGRNADAQVIVPVSNLVEIPGVSKLGRYDLDTGEISELV